MSAYQRPMTSGLSCRRAGLGSRAAAWLRALGSPAVRAALFFHPVGTMPFRGRQGWDGDKAGVEAPPIPGDMEGHNDAGDN